MISIIVPSFNKAKYISETIKSVLNQTHIKWELIIVDDGSTDHSIDVIKNYCKDDLRIKLIERKELPKGGSVCRNIGLSEAKGKYILFLDADDILIKNCLEKRLTLIKQSPNNKFWVFPIGTFYNKIGDSKSTWIPKGKNFLIRFLKHDLPWHTMSVIWDKIYINSLNGFDIDYPRLQDVELHTRALLNNEVSFKTYPNKTIDAYYRIDTKRTKQSLEQQLTKQKVGVITYVKKVKPLLKTRKQKKALKRTLFEYITLLNYNCLAANQELELHNKIYKELIKFVIEQKANSLFDRTILNLYVSMYKVGFWKIKGFNFTMKYFFTLRI